MRRSEIVAVGVVLAVVGAVAADAAVFCQKPSGAVFIRTACKKKETQVNLAAFGAVGPKGDTGAQGPKGDTGAAGTPATRLFAAARADGTLLRGSPGVTVSKYLGQTGAYQVVLPQDVTNCVAVGSIGESTGNGLPAGEITTRTNGLAAPSLGHTVDVITRDSSGTNADLPFNVAVFC